MRLQARPRFRASAGVTFATFEDGFETARAVVQSKLWPANCRLLDPVEAGAAAGLDGTRALLILGFESAEVPQGEFIQRAIDIARAHGGEIDAASIVIADDAAPRPDVGRQGAVGAWRDSFLRAPYQRNLTVGLGLVGDTFETAITWDRWPEFHARVSQAAMDAINRVCRAGTLSCRFTHVYTDGPAPYYTFNGLATPGGELEAWRAIKSAASDAIIAAGGTITHHHAVGRDHRPWYDRQRPGLFAESLRAVKATLDPAHIMNPGVLID